MPAMSKPEATRPILALFRAREDGARSAARLEELGFAVARLPVIAVAAVDAAPKRRRYDAVLATSEKAFLADVAVDRASPLFVVGGRTWKAAEARGWRLGAPPCASSARLVALVRQAVPEGAALLYLAGRDRKPSIETALAGRNDLDVLEVYAAQARSNWRPAEVRSLMSCRAALHYSRRSASLAADLADRAGCGAWFRAMSHVCLSEDVATPLRAIGASDVLIAGAPEEEALFATVEE